MRRIGGPSRRGKVLFGAAVGLVALCGLAVGASAGLSSATIISGNGTYGNPDAVVQTSLDGVNWNPATVSACCDASIPGSHWDTIPGTQWVSNPSGTVVPVEPQIVGILFRVTFTLPAAFTTPSLAITQHVDDHDIVFLNGTEIGRATDLYGYWAGTPQQFATSDASLFHPGTNQLLFNTDNLGGGPGGLDFSATVNWQAVPVALTTDDCKNDGWRSHTRADGSTFKNQGDCIQYVNTGK